MKKWMKNLLAVITLLNYTEKAKQQSLSAGEIKQICDKYEEKYGTTLEADKAANLDAEEAPAALTIEDIKAVAAALNVSEESVPISAIEALHSVIKAINNLSRQSEQAAPQTVQAQENAIMAARVCGLTPHTAAHLFGIEEEMYSRKKWYNNLTATRKALVPSGAQLSEFKEGFSKFASAFRDRLTYLNANGMLSALNYADMVKGSGKIDYSELTSTAGEYIVRRTDLILAYFKTLPSVSGIFPVVSGVQNKEIAPTAQFGGLSQGYRQGRIFKGNVKFAAEVYEVADCMFKYNFTNLEELEKKYIGYLNREGSGVIKWTLIEWILVEFGTILISEQNMRRVSGVRVPQQAVVANPANFAADGALRAIERAEEAFKILPFSDFGTYTALTILDTVEGMWDKFTQMVPSVEGYKIYMNARHKQMYVRAYRAKYGQDSDFAGSVGQLVDLDPANIIWVPNMAINCFKIWIAQPGNIVNLEFVPGEMNAFEFTPEFEGVVVASRWKEGALVQVPGPKYASASELAAAGYKNQFVFTNFPISNLTITSNAIDVSANQVFLLDNHAVTTGEGQDAVTTPAAAINTVNKYAEDQCIKFIAKAKDDELPKSGAFSKIASDFKANAAGDFIVVYPEFEDYTVTVDGETITASRPTGKFLELRRSVTSAQ